MGNPDLELAVVIGIFQARTGREADVAEVLAKYVVLTRRQPACRNVDLVASGSRPDRFVVIEKWESADGARAFCTRANVSPACTGRRIVRPVLAMPRVIAWRIHQVAYVENLKPLRQSNFSTACMSPRFPSWIRSRSGRPEA